MGPLTAAAAALVCLALASCAGRSDGSTADEAWNLEGVVTAVEPGPGSTRVTVELAAEAAAAPEAAVLLVSPETEVTVQRADGTVAPGAVADVAVGARIRARHTGAELRSLPPQYQATHIRVVAAAPGSP